MAVVGWLATWPAEPVRGTIVTDRAARRARGSRGRGLDPHACFPASRAAELAALLVRPRDLTREDLARYVPLTAGEYEAARRALAGPRRPSTAIRSPTSR